ncbi:MAG: recombination mediator RecR [Phycisphaeraceae bacterium]|nr:recombination mediator RecR [Phycisphaeraceae bacterium]
MGDARQPKPPTSDAADLIPGANRRGLAYPAAVERLIEEFSKLPGIGRKSAERLAFYILKNDEATASAFARAILDVKQKIKHCRICWNLADEPVCGICNNPARDRSQVLVVEQPKDLIALEQTGMYRGTYHVLMGRLSPLDGVEASDLTIADLVQRAKDPASNAGGVPITEIILGLNPTLEGDGTGLYLQHALESLGVGITRLARGLPSGSQLEYANKAVLADAIQSRQRMSGS